MIKTNKKLKIPKETWDKEFKHSNEHPIDLRNKLQKIISDESGCVEAQLRVADDTYLIDPDNAIVEFTVGSDNGCDLCFLKKQIEDNHRKICKECEFGLGSTICPICKVGNRDIISFLEKEPEKEPAVYLVTYVDKGIPEIIKIARTREEVINVMANHKCPENIEVAYGDESWLDMLG